MWEHDGGFHRKETMMAQRQQQATKNGRQDEPRASRQIGSGSEGAELQRFGAVRPITIALGPETRTESSQLLNAILADTMILYALYKKHHWVVAGPTFYQLHLLFDKHAGEQSELIDLLAERVQSLGATAVGDPRHAAELTTIERPPNGAEGVPAMLHRLLRAHETVITKVRDAIERTDRNGDWGSNDLLMSDVLRRHELQVWFVSAHLADRPLTGETD
jgi:starvation-inducible DNA-binding protein